MPRYRVELSPEALGHAREIQEWWRANRPKSPGLFLRDLRAAIGQLRRSPYSGTSYEPRGVHPTRRFLLPGSRYHIYYWPDDEARRVRIYAIWHTARGEAPPRP